MRNPKHRTYSSHFGATICKPNPIQADQTRSCSGKKTQANRETDLPAQETTVASAVRSTEKQTGFFVRFIAEHVKLWNEPIHP